MVRARVGVRVRARVRARVRVRVTRLFMGMSCERVASSAQCTWLGFGGRGRGSFGWG